MSGIQTRLKLIAADSGARVKQHISRCGNIVIPFAFVGANSVRFILSFRVSSRHSLVSVGALTHRLYRDGRANLSTRRPEVRPVRVARRLRKHGFQTISITRTTMRPDHTADEFVQTQPLLPTSPESERAGVPQRQISALSRVTFCFAWLFGLEPFLTGSAGEMPRSRLDRQ
ncbi:hypothetical protein [Paraburkholderia sp. BL18I3N2]|uniref:hypothetical protein n=1 Tax=Paraburkholderia sp. BL18I3N2 TaxID=1938799 RepID=UPI002158B595|nr:hypothetical protein [Paraburkholderia sp. BL18I3N2]